jgi:hypothetical protein
VPDELITVAETPTFIRQAQAIWSDEERGALIEYIARSPEAGDVIPETGGIRKLRWTRPGKGKPGGARVVYFFYDRKSPLYLLMAYEKAARDDIPPEAKKTLREFASRIKSANRSRIQRRSR